VLLYTRNCAKLHVFFFFRSSRFVPVYMVVLPPSGIQKSRKQVDIQLMPKEHHLRPHISCHANFTRLLLQIDGFRYRSLQPFLKSSCFRRGRRQIHSRPQPQVILEYKRKQYRCGSQQKQPKHDGPSHPSCSQFRF
jgi:hypothetical protein